MHWPDSRNVRVLVAGAALAYRDNPERYAAKGVAQQVVERVRASQQQGTRYRGGGDDRPRDDALAERDRGAGRRLFETLVERRQRETAS